MRPPERVAPSPIAFFEAAEKDPDRPRFHLCAGDGFVPLTWRAHAAAVREIAAYLLASGLQPGDRCAIFSANRIEWLEAAFAIQSARGVMVPIYPSCTADQASYVIEHAGVRFLFVDGEEQLQRVLEKNDHLGTVEQIILLSDREHLPRILSWSQVRSIGREALEEEPDIVGESLARIALSDVGLLLYTSGTTGRPKGVPLTHANVVSNTEDWIAAIVPAIPEGGVDLLWLPFSHVFGWGEVGLGNVLGFTSWLVRPDQAIAKMPEVRPSIFMSVPSYWEKIAKLSKESSFDAVTGGRLRFCLSGGAGLNVSVKEHFRDNGVVIIEGYGLTETSPTLTINRPDDYRFDSVGKPLRRVQIRIAEDGEILAKGPNVFAGYYRDDDASARAFTSDGWFLTGDVGRFTEDGFLQITDRKKDILVTSGGKNVPPANIELRFKDDPLIDHVIVYGDGKPYLVAGVWPNRSSGATDLERELSERIDAVNRSLASFETIKRFAVMEDALTIESGMLTATLKPKRKQIYDRYRDRFEELYR
jgi:long-chain acyl-CoA synthetase